MKNTKIKLSVFIGCLFLLVGMTTSVTATETLSGTGFYKEVEHPDNQITDGEALNLMMKPGQKQQVKVKIHNVTDEKIVVESKIAGARTNGNGGLEYSPTKLKKDKSMKYDLTDLVTIPSSVEVPAKGIADLVLDIAMPSTAYDGIVTGGIQLMEKDRAIETTDENGAVIENKVAYLFGVTLQMTKTEVKPDFDLVSVEAGLQNYRNAIFINLSNTQSMISKDLTLTTEITGKGKTDVLYEKKKMDISMAPHSIMQFPVSLDGDVMKAGDYEAHVVLKGYDQEWKWDKEFTITEEEADKFNQQDPYLVQERGLDWKMIGLIIGGVLLLVIIIMVILKATKKNKKKKSKRKSTRR